jgi:hypothetical protein
MGEVFKNTYFYSLLRNQILLREFSRVSSAFQQAKARVVPIKGAAFLQDIYPVPSRFMEDIDLLAEETNLRAAGEVLAGLGYLERLDGLSREYWLNKQCHLQFIKPGAGKLDIGIDLHFSLDFKRGGRNILPRLWGRLNGSLLSCEDSLFCLALHQRRFGKPLCLKNVIDAGLILKKYQDILDWGYLFKEARSGRMGSSMFFLLEQVKIVFGGEIRMPDLKQLCPSIIRRKLAASFIRRNIFSVSAIGNAKKLYLKAHFLLYDDFLEPAVYVLNIPQEQFAKFYGLKQNSENTNSLYRKRIAYIFYRSIRDIFRKSRHEQPYD